MKDSLVQGLKHEATLFVDDSLIVPNVSAKLNAFADMPPVFATAFMVGFIEATCIELIAPHLHDDEHSVGTHIDVSHIAATLPGTEVTVQVELDSVEGRSLAFRVAASDETGLIGKGTHKRAIIIAARFISKLQRNAGKTTQT
ncbi:thioesterase family protein [Ruegeria sp. EL01]|jgi:fluoroacetyl-CoA thioesterase|uniref:thioesterase family protein n=1 Tax=Ruegeria sp. EL01 TaxID=2107578 RepID=UPI000EA82900|nr:thioesterase family protein [Ruegeria sp. EL01]